MTNTLKPTIAILHFGGETFRGTEACVVNAINGLHEHNYEVIFLANNPSTVTEKLNHPPRSVFEINYPEIIWDDRFSLPLWTWLRTVFKIRNLLKYENPSLLLTSGGLPAQIGLPIARLLGLPIAVHFHHPAPKRYFYFWFIPWVDKVIVPSRHTQAVVDSKCKKKSSIVYNGIDVIDKFYPVAQRDSSYRATLEIPSDAIVITTIGALVKHKRVELFLEALAIASREPHIKLHGLIIGTGEEEAHLKELATSIGIDACVSFISRVPEIHPYLQHVSDIYISTSSEEGFGLTVVEAAACGLASIVSASGALTEVVDDGLDGIHLAGSDAKIFADAILRLASDKDLRSQMGNAGRQKAVERFSLLSYKKELVNSLEELIHQYSTK